jgi:DNA polymerase V
LRDAIALYLNRAAEKLRRAGLAAGVITVFISTGRFSPEPQYSNAITYELASMTDSTEELLPWALRGVRQIFRSGYKYRQAGVILHNLLLPESLSLRLYDAQRFAGSRRLMKAMDEINRRYGRDTVRFGIVRPKAHWQTKFRRRSPRYTTRLSEVLSVK